MKVLFRVNITSSDAQVESDEESQSWAMHCFVIRMMLDAFPCPSYPWSNFNCVICHPLRTCVITSSTHLHPHHRLIPPVHHHVRYRVAVWNYQLLVKVNVFLQCLCRCLAAETINGIGADTHSSRSPQCSSACPGGSSAGPSCRPGWWWTSCRRWWPRPRVASPSCSAPSHRGENWKNTQL